MYYDPHISNLSSRVQQQTEKEKKYRFMLLVQDWGFIAWDFVILSPSGGQWGWHSRTC